MEMVEAFVSLLDELEKHRLDFDPATREFVDHVDLRVQEILERFGVEVIEGDAEFDMNRHQPERGLAQANANDAILETLRPGLAIGPRVFRRAIVRLAKGTQ
jgi:molecular chaperone GrpE (heat shock protein)